MSELRFIWDETKAAINAKKHGISFAEAETVFCDERGLEFFDPDNSTEEDRFILFGMSFQVRLLVVCHCVREEGDVIRIISARKATRYEESRYAKENL